LPPISESPQRRKAFTQTMGKIAKSRVDVGWANWLAATVLSQAKEANERVKTAQGAISPPLASLSPSSGSTNIAPTPSPEAQMMGAPPPAPPRGRPRRSYVRAAARTRAANPRPLQRYTQPSDRACRRGPSRFSLTTRLHADERSGPSIRRFVKTQEFVCHRRGRWRQECHRA
jgi:hypothetical protein